MNRRARLQFRLLEHSQLGQDSLQSLLISLLRGIAALEVAAAHLRAEFFPGLATLAAPTLWYQALAFFTGFAHQAVVVFFLISGWLVGGSLRDKLGQPQAIGGYMIDRITRLWTVLIPTMLLSLLLAMLAGHVNPYSADLSPSNDYSITAFAGNLFGLQTISLPRFGGNYPLWSLANETWYYLLFPLLLLAVHKPSGWPRRLLCTLLLTGCAIWLPLPLLLYFSLWLLGAVFARIQIDCGYGVRMVLLLVLIGLAVLIRLKSIHIDLTVAAFPQYLVLGLVLLVLLSSTQIRIDPRQRQLLWLGKWASCLAGFSFTLYVVHVPVLHMVAWLGRTSAGKFKLAPDRLMDLGLYLGLLGLVLIFAYGFSRLFEIHTPAIRHYVKKRLLRRQHGGASAVHAKP